MNEMNDPIPFGYNRTIYKFENTDSLSCPVVLDSAVIRNEGYIHTWELNQNCLS